MTQKCVDNGTNLCHIIIDTYMCLGGIVMLYHLYDFLISHGITNLIDVDGLVYAPPRGGSSVDLYTV